MSGKSTSTKAQKLDATAGTADGIRQIRATSLFRLINFELYARPNKIIMGVGLACATGAFGYLAYMRWKYENMGYYTAVHDDGNEILIKKELK